MIEKCDCNYGLWNAGLLEAIRLTPPTLVPCALSGRMHGSPIGTQQSPGFGAPTPVRPFAATSLRARRTHHQHLNPPPRVLLRSFTMAAAIRALNTKIRSNPYTDYFCSTRTHPFRLQLRIANTNSHPGFLALTVLLKSAKIGDGWNKKTDILVK